MNRPQDDAPAAPLGGSDTRRPDAVAPDGAGRVFALLDDRDASLARPTSRLYTGFVREHRVVDPDTLDAVWPAVEADLRRGLHAVLLGDYEWGAKLLRAGTGRLSVDDRSALRLLMFQRLERLSRGQVDAWLQQGGAADAGDASASADGQGNADADDRPPGVAGVSDLEASVERPAFIEAIGRIHEAIRNGETYQVNYTYRLQGRAYGEPVDLYRRLRARQPVSYGAYIQLPQAGGDAVTHVLSCSPELFLRNESGAVTARPMKGTASRIAGPEGDSETARHLSIDIKNRAENLMIVDLLRNDIGRVALTGSVKVPELFVVEPYSTVFQMTSTVRAKLQPSIDMPALLRAVFPCGSITGAPKHNTMQIIAGLESTPRGLYTGAIGWLDAPRDGARIGDFCLSVAIRTLTLGPQDAAGERVATLGIGAGIVLDSVAADEYEECRLKARFLTGLDPGFELFETLRGSRASGVPRLAAHLDRLQASAARLGFRFERAAAQQAIEAARPGWPAEAAMRLRLALAFDGRLTLTAAVLGPVPAPAGPDAGDAGAGALPTPADAAVALVLSNQRLPDADPLAAHKTTRRSHYDAAIREAEPRGAFDALFFSRDGRLVEGGRSNVFLRLDGRWFTPPVADGALPGVMRAALLADPRWDARERSLRREDLDRAEAIVVCNALRGVLVASLQAVRDEAPHP